MPSEYSVLLTTAGSPDEAQTLGRGLVEEQLVACVQLLPINSIYAWNDDIEQDSEVLMLLKAQSAHYASIEAYLLQHHSYDTPEILQLKVEKGSEGYLSWIDAVSAKPG